MAESSPRVRGCAIAAAVAVLLIAVGGVALLVGGVLFGPGLAVDALVEDEARAVEHPISAEPANPIIQEVTDALRADRRARLTGPQLTRLVRDELGDRGRGGIAIEGGVARVDLALDARDRDGGGGWVNLHAVGSFTFEDGWVTQADLRELEVSGWDVGAWMGDGSVADQVNQQLARLRAEEPDAAAKLDAIERIELDGDAVVLTIHPEGLQYLSDVK